MARRFTFFCLFYSVFILAGFAQQVDWVKQAQGWTNSNGNGSTTINGFHRDDAGNFYTEMPVARGFGPNLPLNFFGTVVNAPTPYHNYKVLGKFDSNMNLVWAAPFRSNPGVHNVYVREIITVDKAGSVYFLDKDTTFKFTSNGKLVWKKPFSGFDIRTNKQGLLDFYQFKNGTNFINGSPIQNILGTVVTLDTAGNYVRHFTLQNSAYESQIILGKNNTGYYGTRVSARPPGYNGPARHEFFTCDSLGNILKTGRFNYNYHYNGGPTNNTSLIQTAYDPDREEYYMVAIHRIVNPINKPDSSAGKPQQLSIIKLNANLQVTGFLPLGPLKPTGLGGYPFFMRAHKGNLFFSSKTEWTTISYYSHFGVLNPHKIGYDRAIAGKLDRNLNISWFMDLGDDWIEPPIPTDDGIYFCGTSVDFTNKYMSFNAIGYTDAFIIKVTDKDSTTALISGKLFHDLNQNGVDDNEPGLTGYSISSNTVGGVAYSASNGFYQTSAVTGLNTLKSNSIPKFWVRTTPDSLLINVPAAAAQLNGLNFGMRPVSGIKDASINLTPLTAARINMPVMYQLTYRNLATDILNGSIKMVKAPELTFQNASVTPDVISGDTLTWHYASLMPGEIKHFLVKFTLPNNPALNNRYLKSEANITPLAGDTIQENNHSKNYHRVTGPLDPNDIIVTPSCSIDRPFITDGKYLEYRIRFQNIGTDTAFSVAIHDTLSSFLDQSTLEFVASSHNARFWIKENVLTIFFENIKLPHGAANYPSSHGFFTYRIKPKINTPVFVSIKNKAAIYFDFNEPILTNEAITPVTSYITPFTSTQEHIKCHGDLTGKITINNTCIAAPVRYSLDSISFQPSPIFSQLPGGNYSVWIKTDDKSYKINSVQVQQPDSINAVFTIKHATTFIDGEITINTTGGVAPYSFKLNGTTTSFVGHFGYLAPGTYQVEIKDQNNCTKTYSVVIRNIAGINDQEIEGINIYPNPFTSRLILETGPETGNAQIELYNSVGQVVLVEQVRAAKTILDLEQVPTGVYLLKVTTATGYHTRTVIKK